MNVTLAVAPLSRVFIVDALGMEDNSIKAPSLALINHLLRIITVLTLELIQTILENAQKMCPMKKMVRMKSWGCVHSDEGQECVLILMLWKKQLLLYSFFFFFSFSLAFSSFFSFFFSFLIQVSQLPSFLIVFGLNFYSGFDFLWSKTNFLISENIHHKQKQKSLKSHWVFTWMF